MAMSLGDIIVNVKSDTSQLVKGFKRAENSVTKTAKNMNNAIKILTAGFIGLSVVDLAKSLGRQADEMTNIDSKLKLVTKSTKELIDTQEKLFKISQKTRSNLANNVDLYQKISFSTKELNLTQKRQLDLTEQINKELLISGTTSAGAATLITQLGQAFSSNFKAVSQELNTLKDQAPSLYQTILAGMGKTGAEFKKMAEAGELSSEMIISAIEKQAIKTNENFSKIATTMDKASGNVRNSAVRIIGEFDKITGASKFVSDSILNISKSMDEIDSQQIEIIANNISKTFDDMRVVASALNGEIEKTGNLFDGATNPLDSFNIELLNLQNSAVGVIAFMSTINASLENTSLLFKNAGIGVASLINFFSLSSDEYQKYSIEAQKEVDSNRARIKTLEEIGNAGIEAGEKLRKSFLEADKEREKLAKSILNIPNIDVSKSPITKTEDFSEFDEDLSGFNDNIEFQLAQNKVLFDDRVAKEEELSEIKLTLQAQATELITSDIDKINEKMLPVFELMQDVWNPKQMETFFDVWNKQLKKVTKEQKKYDGIGSSDWTAGLKGQSKDIANLGNAFKDIGAEQKKWNKYSAENVATEEDKNKHLKEQVGVYGNLAGAMVNMAEEGSSSAKALQVVQAGLALTSLALGAMEQSKLPYPYNLVAMASTVATGISIMSSLGGSGGGGGSASSISGATMQESEFQTSMLELSNQPIIDELERQTELLELIGLEGTAGRARLKVGEAQFNQDIALIAEEIIRSTQTVSAKAGYKGSTVEDVLAIWESQFSKVNKQVEADIFILADNYKRITFNAQAFRENALAALGAVFEFGLTNRLADWREAKEDGARTDAEIASWTTAKSIDNANNMQEAAHDFIMSMSDVVDTMIGAKDSFKDLHDDLSTSFKFVERDLERAQKTVKGLITGSGAVSFTDYLQKQVLAIEAVEREFTTDITTLFLSKSPADLEAQAAALSTLNKTMDTAFTVDKIEDAINAVDAIEMVGEAMAEIAEQGREFKDRLARIGASEETILLMDRIEELSKVTDKYNRSLLEEIYAKEDAIEASNNYIEQLSSDIDSLNGVLSSLSGIIDKLKGATLGTDYSLNKFYDSMNTTLELSKSGDTDAFTKSLSLTIGASNILFNKDAFDFKRDMLFAQAVAVNQFEGIEIDTKTQIDYLQEIADNTKQQLVVFQDGDFSKMVSYAYEVALGRTPDIAGAEYWNKQLETGAVSPGDLTSSIATAAVNYTGGAVAGVDIEASKASASNLLVKDIYKKYDLEKYQTDDSGYDYWAGLVASGELPISQLNEAIRTSAEAALGTSLLPQFANGTPNVPSDMVAGIHQGEIIVPETFSNGLRNGDLTMGNQSDVVALLNGILSKLEEQKVVQEDSKDIQDASLEKLEQIEEAS